MLPGKHLVIQHLILYYLPTELPQLYEYMVDVEINTVDVAVLQQLKNIVGNISLPIIVSDFINITEINITYTGKRILLECVVELWLSACIACY